MGERTLQVKFAKLVLIGLLLLLLATAACRPLSPDSKKLQDELRFQSAGSGLALTEGKGWDVTVIPFDGQKKAFRIEQTRQLLAIGNAGRMAVWIYRPSFLERDRFLIDFVDGRRVKDLNTTAAARFVPLALSENAARIAFWGRLQGRDKAEGLHWATLDFSRVAFIDEGKNCDWSPDGAALVYEKKNEIHLFDVGAGSSKPLAAGSDPTWSPDGRSIAYRSPAGRASLMTTGGAPRRWSLDSHAPAGALRWSPDGRYVSFSELTPGLHIPFVAEDYRLLACRVKDGRCITASRAGGVKVAGANAYYWMLDYRKFCSGCKPGV